MLSVVICGVLLMATSVSAMDTWPNRQINLVVPFPPGGGADQLGRIVAEQLAAEMGQPVVVENRAGAGGAIGSLHVVRANADGYTLLVGSVANVLNHYYHDEPAYDVRKDLVPVAQLIQYPNYLAVKPSSPFNSIEDIVQYAKSHPNKLSCANSGVGTSQWLSCFLLNSLANVDIVNVPYRGGIPSLQDTISGQVDMVFAVDALPFINDGRLKGIAVSTPERSPYATNLPAIGEIFTGYDITSWVGVFAPAGTPEDVVKKLSTSMQKILENEKVRERMAVLGATPVMRPYAQFAEYVELEFNRWGQILGPLNIRLN
jgi:tripartite-type tricarboxylate transporter receptor subunit TctC